MRNQCARPVLDIQTGIVLGEKRIACIAEILSTKSRLATQPPSKESTSRDFSLMNPSTPGRRRDEAKGNQHFAGSSSSEANGKIMSSCGGFKAILSNFGWANGTTFLSSGAATRRLQRGNTPEVVLRSREGL